MLLEWAMGDGATPMLPVGYETEELLHYLSHASCLGDSHARLRNQRTIVPPGPPALSWRQEKPLKASLRHAGQPAHFCVTKTAKV